MKKGLIIENVQFYAAGAKGVTIGKTPEGQTLFVKGLVPGDVADVKIIKKRRKYVEGMVMKIKEYSDKRTEPKCEHFGTCGGCKWQNMSYEAQLAFKQDEVLQNLRRIGGIEEVPSFPILGAPEPYYYRNKMDFAFSNSRWLTTEEIQSGADFSHQNALGFHIAGQWSKVLDVKTCHLMQEPVNEIRNEVKAYAEKKGLTFFDLKNQSGLLRNLMIRNTSIGEWMVLVQFFEDDKKAIADLLNHLKDTFPMITSLLYVINPKQNDTIYDLDVQCFDGEPFIQEKMFDLTFEIGAKSFFQTNSEQAKHLYEIALDFADLKGDELVYDLYSGTGTIAQIVAKNVKKVVGVESVAEATDAAKKGAEQNGLNNCTFVCGDMKDILNQEFIKTHGQPDVIITDPPRDGMHPKVVENILLTAPEKVVYVSCNSATQARDIALMKEHYEVVKSQAVDMFPQTHHVENVVLLVRK